MPGTNAGTWHRRSELVVASKAEIRTGPRWDEEHQDWVCTMRKLVAGSLVTVVLGIDEDDDVLVITAH